MVIGKLSIGIRANKNNWKKYIIPKETQNSKDFQHPYYKFGIWWLIFFAYYPKKCPICGTWMCGNGGIRDKSGNILCKHCASISNEVEYPMIYKDYCGKCTKSCSWNTNNASKN